jgi:hypothetical protein
VPASYGSRASSPHISPVGFHPLHFRMMGQLQGINPQGQQPPNRFFRKQRPHVDPPFTPPPDPVIPQPEAFGSYAVGIDPKQFKVDRSLRPGRAFRNTGVSSSGMGGMGGGFGNLFSGGRGLEALIPLLQQLGGGGRDEGPIVGGR